MKILVFTLSVVIVTAASAQAETFSMACGEKRDQGYKEAEVSLVDEDGIRLYLDGEKMPEDRVSLGNADDGWTLTLEGKKGSDDRVFEFSEEKKNVQEYSVGSDDKMKKIGKPKKCVATGLDD